MLWKALVGRMGRADRVERLASVLFGLVIAAPIARSALGGWPTWLDTAFLTAGPLAVVAVGLALTRQLTLRPTITGFRVRRAIRRGEIFLCYQPKLDLGSGELDGVEALVRWRHPRSGMLPPTDWIELEVTERALERGDAPDVAERLLALGTRVVLDDFGMGYSSLSRLVRLHVDGVKIDRSFVIDIENPRSDAVVSWAAGLARGLGLSLAAEGVETPTAWQRLRSLGVDSAQGFLMAQPLTPDQLDAWRADEAAIAAALPPRS